MIDDDTARQHLYDWHGGQWSAFYAAASSGLVESFAALAAECCKINEPDRSALQHWIEDQEANAPEVSVSHHTYHALPWARKE